MDAATAIPSLSTPLDAGLTAKQKARLHEVADLLLEIYQTLARMQYIAAASIQPGPHDLTAQLPLYASLGLDQRLIYLYSIMPYIDPLSVDHDAKFYQSCSFIDFRQEDDVREARDFHLDIGDPEQALRPWTTALARFGSFGKLVVYEAKRHVVFFVDNHSYENGDPGLRGRIERLNEETGEVEHYEIPYGGGSPEVRIVDVEAWKRENEWEADDDDDEEEGEGEEQEEDGDDEDKNEDEESEPQIPWDYFDSRPAGAVLRDILRWYRELSDVPGCAKWEEEWVDYEDELRALYRKHGWPGEDFDGDAFDLDRARVKPAAEIKFDPGRAGLDTQYLERIVEEREKATKAVASEAQHKLATAKSPDEEWVVRWEIWNAEQGANASKNRLRRAEELADWGSRNQKIEELPLWEWNCIQRHLERTQQTVERLKEELEGAEITSRPQIQMYLRGSEERVTTLHRVVAASRADAERLCPGRPLSSLDPSESAMGLHNKVELDYLRGEVEDLEQGVVKTRAWAAELPQGAIQARELAQKAIDEKLKEINGAKQKMERELEWSGKIPAMLHLS